MKYFMGFLLCLSIMINIAYNVREADYVLIVENTHGETYKIQFSSIHDPKTADLMFKPEWYQTMYQVSNTDSLDFFSVWYKKSN